MNILDFVKISGNVKLTIFFWGFQNFQKIELKISSIRIIRIIRQKSQNRLNRFFGQLINSSLRNFVFREGDLTSWSVARKLQQAQCWRATQIETSFPGIIQLGFYHREHHAASAPRCRGAGDQRCVEIITLGGSPTCILHLHLIHWLSHGTVSHGYSRAQCAIPAIKKEERRKINEKWCRSRTEPKGTRGELIHSAKL